MGTSRERLEYPYCDVDIIRSKAASKARPEAMMRCKQPTKGCLIINQDAFDAVVGLKGIKMESMDTNESNWSRSGSRAVKSRCGRNGRAKKAARVGQKLHVHYKIALTPKSPGA